jgi:hypothetical protein
MKDFQLKDECRFQSENISVGAEVLNERFKTYSESASLRESALFADENN